MQQAGAGLLFARVAILLDEAVSLERLQQAMDGSRGELEPLGQLAHAQAPRAARQRVEDARGTVDRLDPPTLRPIPACVRHCRKQVEPAGWSALVYGLGVAGMASRWRPLTWRDEREESLTAARSADEDGPRCAWLVTENARNDVLGGGEMAGHKAPVRLRPRVHGASSGLLGDGRAPYVMRRGIAFDCRPFVRAG